MLYLLSKKPFKSYTVVKKQSASVTKVGMAHVYQTFIINTGFQVSVQINQVLLYNKKQANYIKFLKEVGIAGKQLVSCLAKKLLSTHSTGNIGYYLCLFMQIQFQLGSCINACTNKTHSLANLQNLIPIVTGIIIGSIKQSKQTYENQLYSHIKLPAIFYH